MIRFITLTSIAIFLLISSCGISLKKGIKEGVIEYDVYYLNKDKESLYSFLLPKKMSLFFKKNKIKTELEGFSGNFYFSIISNTKTDSSIALFKIMNQDYFYIETKKGSSELFGNLPGMQINYSKDTCIVTGFNCKKAKIISKNDSFQPFDICYTKDIKIHNPNKKNPFYEIDGVLLDFCVNLYNMDMRFIANRVIDTNISDNEFMVPEGFLRIGKKDVDQILSLLE